MDRIDVKILTLLQENGRLFNSDLVKRINLSPRGSRPLSAVVDEAQVPIPHLNEHLFPSLSVARRLIETWRIDYNMERPHTSLAGLSPNEHAAKGRSDKYGNGLYL